MRRNLPLCLDLHKWTKQPAYNAVGNLPVKFWDTVPVDCEAPPRWIWKAPPFGDKSSKYFIYQNNLIKSPL